MLFLRVKAICSPASARPSTVPSRRPRASRSRCCSKVVPRRSSQSFQVVASLSLVYGIMRSSWVFVLACWGAQSSKSCSERSRCSFLFQERLEVFLKNFLRIHAYNTRPSASVGRKKHLLFGTLRAARTAIPLRLRVSTFVLTDATIGGPYAHLAMPLLRYALAGRLVEEL